MISSSRQLKDKVRNISDGNSNKASTLIRNFMMERFLERVSISSYRDNFILKGAAWTGRKQENIWQHIWNMLE